MRNTVAIIGLMSLCLSGYAQKENEDLSGRYKDGLGSVAITELTLKEDSTFELTVPDPVFPYTYQRYTTTGRWTHDGNSVRLNENLKEREVQVEIIEGRVDSKDSITVKLNYILEEFENEVLVSSEPFEFEMLTLKLNNKKKGYNFRHQLKHRMCLHARKVKNQVIVDSTNTAVIPRKDLESISVYSYGFKKEVVFPIEDKQTNYVEINITQPVDMERMPRNKEVIVKGNKAFYYERNGKVVTSGMLSPLEKLNRKKSR